MTTSVPLYQPLNTLKPVADDIWIADGDVTWMNMGILRAPFSTRMTVIRLQDGGLWCHSPIAACANARRKTALPCVLMPIWMTPRRQTGRGKLRRRFSEAAASCAKSTFSTMRAAP